MGDVLHMAKVVGAPAEIVELIAARVVRRDPDIVACEEEEACCCGCGLGFGFGGGAPGGCGELC